MHPERGMQAAVGVVVAFSLLWTVAILIPDSGGSRSAAQRQFGLSVNGTQYVLDSNAGQQTAGGNVHIIHSASVQRKLRDSSKNTQRRLQTQPPATQSSQNRPTNGSSSSKKRDSLFPRWAWFSAFVLFNASRFIKKKEEPFEEDWLAKVRDYEEDFLSVDGSMYGSMAKWSGDEWDKFDV